MKSTKTKSWNWKPNSKKVERMSRKLQSSKKQPRSASQLSNNNSKSLKQPRLR